MGKLIKINMYSEKNNMNDEYTDIKTLESSFKKYSKWLVENDKTDKMEYYAAFLNM